MRKYYEDSRRTSDIRQIPSGDYHHSDPVHHRGACRWSSPDSLRNQGVSFQTTHRPVLQHHRRGHPDISCYHRIVPGLYRLFRGAPVPTEHDDRSGDRLRDPGTDRQALRKGRPRLAKHRRLRIPSVVSWDDTEPRGEVQPWR